MFVVEHAVLFQQLKKLQGPVDVKCLHVRDIMHQASRFKRKQLITLLEQFEQSILINSNTPTNSNNNGAR